MKFFDRLKFAGKVIRNQVPFDKFVRDWLSGNESSSPSGVYVGTESALKFSAVFACCRVISETLSSLPIKEYRKNKDGSREETDDTGILDILRHAANEEMSGMQLHEMGMYQINLGGNLVCDRLVTGTGELVGLYPYQWERVEIKRNHAGRLVYVIDGKQDKARTRPQIFHIAGPSLDGIAGMSPIEYSANAIRLGLTYDSFQNQYFKNGAIPSGVFEHPQHLREEAFKALKEDIKKNYSGLVNAGVPMILEDGMKYSQLTMKFSDAQLLESRKFQVEDVCRVYRVPLHLVQNLDKATNNNIEHQSLEFAMYTMLPVVKRWESSINSQLLSPLARRGGYFLEYNMAGLVRGDMKSMYEAFAIGRQWGFLSVNDIRRLLNMNPIPNGDIYLQPMNMIEAGTVDPAVRAEIEKLIESAANLRNMAR